VNLDEFYAKFREMVDAEIRSMEKHVARRFIAAPPDNMPEIKALYEAGKTAEAQRMILDYLKKELGA